MQPLFAPLALALEAPTVVWTIAALLSLFVAVVAIGHAASGPVRQRRNIGRRLRQIRRTLGAVRKERERLQKALDRSTQSFRKAQLVEWSSSIPVELLKDDGATRVRWSVLRENNLRTVDDVIDVSARKLRELKGIGVTTAERIIDAAEAARSRLERRAPELPDPGFASTVELELARQALVLLTFRDRLRRAYDHLVPRSESIASAYDALRPRTRVGPWLRSQLGGGLASLAEDLQLLAERVEGTLESEAWETLVETWPTWSAKRATEREAGTVRDLARARYSELAVLLEESFRRLGFEEVAPSTSIRGGLPDEIVNRVEAFQLETKGLDVTLRSYQRFGAQYMLAQKRSILGDEMGLGKTIQALAAMTHVHNERTRAHLLVVAPAGLIWNWIREAEARASFPAYPLHGDSLDESLTRWRAHGGLAVTSYATLRNLSQSEPLLPEGERLTFLIADEAHYLKNPRAGRTRATLAWVERSDHVSLMTGTPQENHPQEFLNLIQAVQPEVAAELHDTGDFAQEAHEALQHLSGPFHAHIAGVYLRRNQDDVLRELPECIELEEWVELTPEQSQAYKEAVAASDFMALRRATVLPPGFAASDSSAGAAEDRPWTTLSAKLEHLEELLLDHQESGRKVVLFSYFLDVLAAVDACFDCIGSITGAMDPRSRIELVDRFQEAEGFSLLLCQIDAGGVGLNLQKASVVVLMEPQLKPSTEDQAIARVHRMGQLQRVLVHRLLARDTVDERLVDLVGEKRSLFESYARQSALQESSRSDEEGSISQRVLEEERARWMAPESDPPQSTG